MRQGTRHCRLCASVGCLALAFAAAPACADVVDLSGGAELEAGAGAGFPGVQLGVSARKLFGDLGEFFVFELSLAGNAKVSRGTNPLDPTKGTHVWTNLGIGFEHRAGLFSLGLTGGAAFLSFSQTPAAYVHGGIGLGF